MLVPCDAVVGTNCDAFEVCVVVGKKEVSEVRLEEVDSVGAGFDRNGDCACEAVPCVENGKPPEDGVVVGRTEVGTGAVAVVDAAVGRVDETVLVSIALFCIFA